MIESLAAKLAARKFVVTGELTPPKGTDLSKLFAAAELLRGSVDAINVTESAAWTRFSAAQPRLTKTWWSSGSITGVRRAGSGAIEIVPSPTAKRHGWVLWLFAARVA
jgi:hypothetical protein